MDNDDPINPARIQKMLDDIRASDVPAKQMELYLKMVAMLEFMLTLKPGEATLEDAEELRRMLKDLAIEHNKIPARLRRNKWMIVNEGGE